MADYKILNSRGKGLSTDVTLHPGEVLEMELLARNLKKSDFAMQLGDEVGAFK